MGLQKIYIGFDFSINKPACTIYNPSTNEYRMLAWPIKLTKKTETIYLNLESKDLIVHSRHLESTSSKTENSQQVIQHIQRASDLADRILKDIFYNIDLENTEFYISSEGLSFNSVGNSTLDLATYKGIFLCKLLEATKENLKGLYTYAPISIKSVAGCSKKEDRGSKESMINAFIKCEDAKDTTFYKSISNNILLKALDKNNEHKYCECVDDIVDSFWALKTMIVKENL